MQRNYVTAVELWLLKRMEPVYAHYPWKLLLKSGTKGVATSDYGRNLMREMMLVYDGDQKSKIPLKWIEGAGHNSNTDKPELINSLIEEFAAGI